MIRKDNNKGFTLVELIVAIVILAILAAILVPALLGYIDRSKASQAIVDAKYVMNAAQVVSVEAYAHGDITLVKSSSGNAIDTGMSNYPSLKSMSKLLDSETFGNAGNDSFKQKGVEYSGFGFDDKRNDSGKVDTRKHFCLYISERAEILGMLYCDGTTVVRYSPEKGYTTESANCKKTNRVFNYICIGEDGKSYFDKMNAGKLDFFDPK